MAAAKADGQTALAITDNGNMYGAIDFYKECTKNKIKPIIGVDFFVSPRTRNDKEHRVDDRFSRVVLLAQNMQGYKNLIQLVSKSFNEGYYNGRPRIDRELLAQHSEGLVCIMAARDGEHIHALSDGNSIRARETLEWYSKTFTEPKAGGCYLEVTRHPEIAEHDTKVNAAIKIARSIAMPLLASADSYYMNQKDALAREMIDNIRTAGHLNRDIEDNLPDYSFFDQARANKIFSDLPEALENTAKIADSCNIELTLGTWVFPDIKVPANSSHDAELRALTYRGIPWRGITVTPEITARIEHELHVISSKGYSPYFLVVSDLLQFAKREGIFTNTRGSAAGSLVSYLSGITTVDPLEYQLPFERFLNPERPSPPDIDMDIADNRRDELIDYAREKYGDSHVAQIGTFGTMMARAAVRDVSRALGHSYGVGDRLAKLIPFGKQGFPVTIDGALESTPDLATAYKRDPVTREILDMARTIEGNARHVGVHAAGVVIAPSDVTNYSPIQPDPKGGKMITQYDMYAIEEAGLLKFDFLGLTNLSVLADAISRVRIRLGIEVDMDHLPQGDPKTFAMLSRGETLGVFQMASSGMTNYLVQLKPTRTDDLNVMVALYRPGPMDNIDEYIARKNGTSKITYLHPKMQSYLSKTFGVLVYQDDLLMTAINLAGYSWGEVDKFRKAVGKKIPEEMAKQHVIFVEGCQKHSGMSAADAEKLWLLFEPFQGYGFNKAHAASYGNLSYQTAYMKANFPVDYMASVLTADAGDVDKIAEIVAECKRLKIEVLPPSINESIGTFSVVARPLPLKSVSQADGPRVSAASANAESDFSEIEGGNTHAIRFGLYSIKNFGTGVADSIIAARTAGGPFTDLAEFLIRVTVKNLNKKSLESLILCGALDDFGERGQLMGNVDTLLTFHREHMQGPSDQGSLFGALQTSGPAHLQLKPASAMPMDLKLTSEKELLGLYVSGHPLDKHKEVLDKQKMKLKEARESFPRGVDTVIAGFLESAKQIITKKGDPMIFGQLADMTGSTEFVVFPNTYKEFQAVFTPGTCVALKGKWSDRNGEASFMVDKAKTLN